MSFKDKLEQYIDDGKLGSYKTSSMSFLRENFDDITKLISLTKNQGNGSAYEKIALWCFDEGIKTKDGKPLPKTYINECLVKIRKEKGIRIRSRVKNSENKSNKAKSEKVSIDEKVYSLGVSMINKFFKYSVEQFVKNNFVPLRLSEEQKSHLVLYTKICSNSLRYESLVEKREVSNGVNNVVKFYEAHKEIFGIK